MTKTLVACCIMLALLACKRSERASKPAEPCAEHRVMEGPDMCIHERAELNSFDGFLLDYVNPGDRVVHIVEAPSQTKNVKRGPGHVETRMCALSGQARGKAGYIQNTKIWVCR